MLADEIQRLSELFKRAGDKTGFVRLLNEDEKRQLVLEMFLDARLKQLPENKIQTFLINDFGPEQPRGYEQIEKWFLNHVPNIRIINKESLGLSYTEGLSQYATLREDYKATNLACIDQAFTIWIGTVEFLTQEEIEATQQAKILQQQLDDLKAKFKGII